MSARAADDYPTRTIRAVVPFAPAGVMDSRCPHRARKGRPVARAADRDRQSPGRRRDHRHRPGRARAARRLHIVIADPAGSLAASVSLYPKLNFDPVKDLAPIALLGTSGAVLSVSNTLPAKTLPEFVALAKGRPGELMFGSAGNGTPGHLNGELFKRLTGIDVVHVPYRVGSQAVTDLIAGRILASGFLPSPPSCRRFEAGQLRPLAVSGRTRARELPDVPTVRESGFGDYDVSTSYALFAPAGTPQPILGRLQAEVKRALETESVNSRLRIAGGRARHRSARRGPTPADDADCAMVGCDQDIRHPESMNDRLGSSVDRAITGHDPALSPGARLRGAVARIPAAAGLFQRHLSAVARRAARDAGANGSCARWSAPGRCRSIAPLVGSRDGAGRHPRPRRPRQDPAVLRARHAREREQRSALGGLYRHRSRPSTRRCR